MTDDRAPMTPAEVAARWRVSVWTICQMTRDGRLGKIPGLGRIRIPVAAVEALEGYDATDEPNREAPRQAPTPRGRNRVQANGPLPGEAVGGGGALHRRIGPSPGDVAVR